jgi:hypothetical protein
VSEEDLIGADEFRDGNVPAGKASGQLSVRITTLPFFPQIKAKFLPPPQIHPIPASLTTESRT